MPPKKRILYLGNKLAIHGKPPTAVDLLPEKLRAENYSVIAVSSKKNKIARMLDMIWATIHNRKNIDLILLDTYSTSNFYYAVVIAIIGRGFKLPYIPILHGGNLANRIKIHPRLSKGLFENAFTNVAPSKYILEQFQKCGFSNLTYIPNTLEIENYPFKKRKLVSCKLLWVRSFSEIYNPLLALEVVERLKRKGIEVSLCMVGPDKDGSLARCKKVVSELNLPVNFAGMMTKQEWISLSKDYDIFINTTNFDNMPLSVMEAMALGLPVISTNVGGMPYLIEHKKNGILVPPNDSDAFVETVINLLNYPLTVETITHNAREKMQNLDWEEVKYKWVELLEKG